MGYSIQEQALGNIAAALSYDARRADLFPEEVISNALKVISVLGTDDCPTCPYLDSLEDEDEDFCECGAGEEEESVEDFVSYLDPSFDPTLGTFLIFCKN